MNPWLLGLATLIASFVIRFLFNQLIDRLGKEKNVVGKRIFYIKRTFESLITLITILFLLSIAGINVDDLGVFLGTVVAVLGVSLFAQWSILSNVTASIVVFFFFPYRVGDHVKILDGENTFEGTIKEIALFHVILSDQNDDTVTFPNSMVFQKAVVIQRPKSD